MNSDKQPPNKDRVQAVEYVFRVMDVLANHPHGLVLTEVSELTDLSRAAARRYLLSLVANGYATQEKRRFKLTARIVSLARQWLNNAHIWTLAQPILNKVTETLEESCSIAEFSGEDIIYVARSAARKIMTVQIAIGTKLPIYCTSMGQVLLAFQSLESRNAIVSKMKFERGTHKSISSEKAMYERLDLIRKRGYAINDEELELGLCSIAVPIRNPNGEITTALNLSAPTTRFNAKDLFEKALPVITSARNEIELLILD